MEHNKLENDEISLLGKNITKPLKDNYAKGSNSLNLMWSMNNPLITLPVHLISYTNRYYMYDKNQLNVKELEQLITKNKNKLKRTNSQPCISHKRKRMSSKNHDLRSKILDDNSVFDINKEQFKITNSSNFINQLEMIEKHRENNFLIRTKSLPNIKFSSFATINNVQLNGKKEKINQNTENNNINNYNNNKSNNNNNNSVIDNNNDINNNNSIKKSENIEIIKGNDINFYDKNSTTENNFSCETLALHNNNTDNNNLNNINNNSISTENQKYFNSLVNTEKESSNKFVYKLIDEDIIDEEYYLDVNETLDNIINNRPYIPKNVTDYKNRELYTLIHDKNLRKKYFNNTELRLCPLLEDPIPDVYLPETEDYQYEISVLSEKINSSKNANYEYFKNRAFIYILMGDYKSAYRDFSDSIHFEKQNITCYWYRHLLNLKFNKPASAIKDLEYISEYTNNNALNYYIKSRIYEVMDNKKFAIYNYTCLLQLKPHMTDAYIHRGLLLEAQQQYLYALEDFKNVYQRDCNNIIAIRFLSIYYYKNKFFNEALKTLNRWINIQPSNHKAYFLRGKTNTKLNMWSLACEDYSLAIKLCPHNSKYYLYRGCIERNRNPEKAIEDLSISLLIDNSIKNIKAYFYRAFVYYIQNDNDYAISDLNRIIELDDKNVIAYINLGIITLNRYNQLYEALDYFNHAIECDPNSVQGYICRGNVYSKMYKEEINRRIASINEFSIKPIQKKTTYLDRSIRDFSRAIHIEPSNFIYYLFRGRLLLQSMSTNEAKSDFCTAFELNSSIAQTPMQKLLILSFQKKWEEIITEYENLNLAIQQDSSIYIVIAKAFKNLNNLEGSLKVIERGIGTTTNNGNLYLEKGVILLALNNFDDALKNLNIALSINPKLSSAYYYRSLCYFEKGDINTAFDDITNAIKTDSYPFNAYLIRASIYNYKKLYSLGIEDCNEALKIESLSICGYLLRGAMRFKLRQYGLALNDFTMASFIDGSCYYAFFNRAIIYQIIDEPENALKDFSTVLLLNDSPDAYRYRGLLYWKLGDHNNAIIDLKKALEVYNDDYELYCQYGLCLNDFKKYDEAISAFNKAINLNKCNHLVYLNRGLIYKKVKQFDNALKDFSKTILLNPNNIEAYINIGYIYHEKRKYKKAMEMFSTAITIKPETAAALEGRAMLNYDLKNYFSALYDISHALELDFQNPKYHNNRGIIYKAMNDNMTALQCFKVAVYYDPNFYLAHYNIGIMYYIQKRYDKALISFNKANKLKPDNYEVLLNRGITRVILNVNLKGALEDFNLYIKMNPNSVYGYYNRAHLYKKLGLLKEANEDNNHVIKLLPTESTAYLSSGFITGTSDTKQAMKNLAMHVISTSNDLN